MVLGDPLGTSLFLSTSTIGIHFVALRRNCSLAHNLCFSPCISFLALISQECKLQELCKGWGFCLSSAVSVPPASGSVSGVHSRCSIKMCSVNFQNLSSVVLCVWNKSAKVPDYSHSPVDTIKEFHCSYVALPQSPILGSSCIWIVQRLE